MDIKLERYLADLGDAKLAALFREIGMMLARFDTELQEARRLGQEVSDMALPVDLERAEFINELHNDE